jgi:hypothetical protein
MSRIPGPGVSQVSRPLASVESLQSHVTVWYIIVMRKTKQVDYVLTYSRAVIY